MSLKAFQDMNRKIAALAERVEELEREISRLNSLVNEPPKRGPGRPPKEDRPIG